MNQEREKPDPRIEDELLELPDGDAKENALAFAAYLNANRLAPRRWFGPGYWRVPHEGNYLCGIVVDRQRWRVWFFWGDYGGEFDGALLRTVHDAVRPCVRCTGDDCPKGREAAIFCENFSDVCFQFPIQFENPNAAELDCIKELISYWKGVAPYSDSWHCR